MVDVEERPLRAFEQDALSRAPRLVEPPPRRADERQDLGRDLRQRRRSERGPSISGVADAAAQRVVMGEQPVDLAAAGCRIGEIDDADGAAADLVLVRRTDAAACVVPIACALLAVSRATSSSR